MGFFEKLKQGLSKTASSISSVFTASELDDDFYDDLEESLIVSDLGMDTTETVMDRLRQTVREQHIKTVDEAKIALRAILADMLNVGDSGLRLDTKPSVILVIGVNGVGKTTTIGKLAHQLRDQGKGPPVRGRHLPRRRGRPARDLVGARPLRHHPPARGRRPRLRRL